MLIFLLILNAFLPLTVKVYLDSFLSRSDVGSINVSSCRSSESDCERARFSEKSSWGTKF